MCCVLCVVRVCVFACLLFYGSVSMVIIFFFLYRIDSKVLYLEARPKYSSSSPNSDSDSSSFRIPKVSFNEVWP